MTVAAPRAGVWGRPESKGLDERRMYINGRWMDATSGETFTSFDPFAETPWSSVPNASPADARLAVEAAAEAGRSGAWARMRGRDRAKMLRRIADAIEKRGLDIARDEVRDNGKLLRELYGQLRSVPDYFDYCAGLAEREVGSVIASTDDRLMFTVGEPAGVVVAITAWNSPTLLMTYKVAPALAAGCAVVVKPSSDAPISTLSVASAMAEAEVPDGVFNVVTGRGSVVIDALLSNPAVGKVTFTGSTETGAELARIAASHVIPTSLELGGKSANIVFGDADLHSALQGVVAGIFAAAGQTCVAGARLLVERPIHDRFVASIAEIARTIRLGDPFLEETQMGPLVSEAQRTRVLDYIRSGISEGAVVLVGGGRPAQPRTGYFVEPTVLVGVTNSMRVAREEIFGPVLCVIPFDDADEAIAIANDSPFGLAGGVWTRDLSRAHQVARRLRVGTVWVNGYRAVDPAVPTGGLGLSGYGRENGVEGLREFQRVKSTWIFTSTSERDPFRIG